MDRQPEVTDDDVLRIIRRDFPQDNVKAVLADLETYGLESWQSEKVRVQLAVLKLSRGNLDSLRKFVSVAQQDYRDVLAPAEYPLSFKLAFSLEANTDGMQVSKLQNADWQQYHAWLGSDELCGGPPDADVARAEAEFFRGPANRNHGMPGWTAPILGSFVGLLLALPLCWDRDNIESMGLGIGVGAILGFVAGLVMWAIDQKLP